MINLDRIRAEQIGQISIQENRSEIRTDFSVVYEVHAIKWPKISHFQY